MVQAKFSLVNRPLSPPAQTINEMGGNVPGGNFPSWENFPGRGGEFAGWKFSRWEFSWVLISQKPKSPSLSFHFFRLSLIRNSRCETFVKLTGKYLCQSLLSIKVADLRQKRLWHRSFPVNFPKVSIAPSNTSGRLLLFNEYLSWNQWKTINSLFKKKCNAN